MTLRDALLACDKSDSDDICVYNCETETELMYHGNDLPLSDWGKDCPLSYKELVSDKWEIPT